MDFQRYHLEQLGAVELDCHPENSPAHVLEYVLL
jgi:hypothetical protein